MNHRTTTLQLFKSTGLIPVKVRPKQKDAFSDWDSRTAALRNHAETLKDLENYPDLNIGALFTGKFVDIDVDSYDPRLSAALDIFLPPTPYVWGRKAKPRSHRMYALHSDFQRDVHSTILRYLKQLKINDHPYSIEVRGGAAAQGMYSVMPGSVHPSGEAYEWFEEFDPTIQGTFIKERDLIKAVRLAISAAMISNYWIEGVRNDLTLALTGTLWRIRSYTMAALGMENDEQTDEDGPFTYTKEDAVSLMKAIMELACDDATDQRSRIINLNNTWKKLENDFSARVTGGKVLAEIIGEEGKLVVRTLFKLLSDNDGMDTLDALADQFVIWYGQGVLVDMQLVEDGHTIPWMTKDQAKNSMGDKKIVVGDKRIPVVPLIFGSNITRRIFGLTFDPRTTERLVDSEQGTKVNQWRGLKIRPFEGEVTYDDVKPFHNYLLEIVANGDEGMYRWILSWIADLFQRPYEKPGTALVLVGPQGAGKTFLGERVIGPIIGSWHYAQTNSISQLTDKFNSIIDNKIFLQCDEAVHSYQKDVSSKLKSIISEQTLTIEPKGVNSFKKPNHLHLLFTSNEEHTALFIDSSPYERRFTVSKVSPERARDMVYWTFMHKWVAENHSKILKWLLGFQYEKKFIQRPYDTDAKRTLQRVSLDPEVSWVLSRITAGFPLSERIHRHWWQAYDSKTITEQDKRNNVLRRDSWPDTVVQQAIEDDYKSFVREHGRPVYTGNVITTIRRALPHHSIEKTGQIHASYTDPKSGQTTKLRPYIYSFPTKEEIIDYLRLKFGATVDRIIEDAALNNDNVEAESSEETEF